MVYRSYYAFARRPLTNTAGENTSAPFGFTGFLRDLLRDHEPEYMAVVFDAGVSFRDEIYPDYKATRERMPDDLRASLGYVRELVRGFNLAVVELEGYEADDVIGTLASLARAAGIDSVIVSSDKDFCQLIEPRVTLLNPGRGGTAGVEADWVDEERTKSKFGVAPWQMADYLALVGDSSDNVPGAPGIGPKTAVKLLSAHANLEEVIANTHCLAPPRLGRIIGENEDRIRMSKELVTIRCDLDLELDLGRLAVGEPDAPALRDLFTRLEFRELALEFADQARHGGFDPDPQRVERSFPRAKVVRQPSELRAVVERARLSNRVAIHTESAGAGWGAEPVGLSLAVDDEFAWYLPLAHSRALDSSVMAVEGDEPGGSEPGPFENLPPLTDARMCEVRALLESDGIEWVAHDIKRHAAALGKVGVRLGGEWFDVMIASYLLEPNRRDRSLPQIALAELGEKHAAETEIVGSGRSRRSFAEVDALALGSYCAGNARLALRLANRYRRRLVRESFDDFMSSLEMPLVHVLIRMEAVGIQLDRGFFARMRSRIGQELERLRNEVYALAGGPFNMNSTPQLREVLFERLGLPVIKKTKTGPSTDASVLEELAVLGHAVPQLMLEYRELEKLRSTYVEALPALVDPVTNRLHTSFNQTVAATGRLTSSNPNLQNIPIRTEIGREIRHGFVARPGHLFLSADYSQIELRVLAHISGDESFVGAFRNEIDIHRQTASVLFGVELDEVTASMRDRAKTVNFATLYGQGAFSLGRQLGITRAEAQAFIDAYFEKLDGIRAYIDEQIERAKRTGHVETLMGRRRPVPELRSPNWNVRQAGERIAVNTPVQGTAADLMKKAMIDLQRALDDVGSDAKILLQVHDELLLEVPGDELDEARDIVVDRMVGAVDLNVPLVVECGTGTDWYECKSRDSFQAVGG